MKIISNSIKGYIKTAKTPVLIMKVIVMKTSIIPVTETILIMHQN